MIKEDVKGARDYLIEVFNNVLKFKEGLTLEKSDYCEKQIFWLNSRLQLLSEMIKELETGKSTNVDYYNCFTKKFSDSVSGSIKNILG